MHTEACPAVEYNRRGPDDGPASCPNRGESQCYRNSGAIQDCRSLTGAEKLAFQSRPSGSGAFIQGLLSDCRCYWF